MKPAKLLSALLAAAMVLSLSLGALAFSDVSEDAWYAGAVAYVQEAGLMSGVGEDAFAPNEAMTRAMLATVLHRRAGSPPVTGSLPFTDAQPGMWYTDGLLWVSQQGLMEGYGGGWFGGGDNVTREQLATILWRAGGSPGAAVSAGFADRDDISDYAVTAVDWARERGLLNGKGENRFDPRGQATRAEVATILMNQARQPQDPSQEPQGQPQAEPQPQEQPQQQPQTEPQSQEQPQQQPQTEPQPQEQPQQQPQTEPQQQPQGQPEEEAREPGEAPAESTSSVLVACFSVTGHTRAVAESVSRAMDADLYEIVPAVPYAPEDLNYNDATTRATVEQNSPDARPGISGTVENMARYDVVFLGYPIWWGQAPRIISTFLEQYDFAGKTIVPFCTSGSSPIGSSAEDLRPLTPGAVWLEGQRFAGDASGESVAEWAGGLALDAGTEEQEDVMSESDPRTEAPADSIPAAVEITAGGQSFRAALADTAAAEEFAGRLPLTLSMSELNGNEKYCYLSGELASDPQSPGNIQAGDLMLYGSDCLVLFYESFSTSYSYTRIGQISDPEGLAAALGGGGVEVTFTLVQS